MNKFLIKNGDVENNIDVNKNLLLFPYAGGGTAAFKSWEKEFLKTKLYTVLYPGREFRFAEPTIDNMENLTREIFAEMIEDFDFSTPYYLFGHSMGTKIVYELALKIKNNEYPEPKGIIISSGRAPCYKEPNPIYDLDDEKFIEGLRRYGGTPEQILNNRELLEVFLPMLRSDFTLDEEYYKNIEEKLSSDILALIGDNDEEMKLEELLKWKDFTTGKFNYETVKGNHMYITEDAKMTIHEVKKFIGE